MQRFIAGVLVGAAVFGASLGAACSGGSAGAGGDTPNPALTDVVYEGAATDEALGALLDAKLVNDPTRAANFSWQSAGDSLPLSPIAIFCWHLGSATASLAPSPARTRFSSTSTATSPTTPFLASSTAPREAGWLAPFPSKGPWDRVTTSLAHALLDGIPSAYAHGTPLSGPGYLLVFSTSKDPKLLRVFTTATEYTPNAAAWQKITSTGELVHVVITNADFDQNRIAPSGGPYQGAEISFIFPTM